MAIYQGPIFDADNHYYEAHDAFTRHVPRRMQLPIRYRVSQAAWL